MHTEKPKTHYANVIVLFGAMGDLATRKLFPALYQLELENLLPQNTVIWAIDLKDITTASFTEQLKQKLLTKSESSQPEVLQRFLARINYQALNLLNSSEYSVLAKQLADVAGSKLFYFSTSPKLYGDICQGLYAANLIDESDRLVLEKPIGHSLASSKTINDQVARFFTENQIYRIDHYLGKETVLNLLVLRFANSLFTNNWDRNSIDHVQITVAETVGIEGRWGYYDNSGQLRDMVQNHLLQILALVAMEPPADLHANNVRDEKLKVLNALVPIDKSNIKTNTVRGQYCLGYMNGQQQLGYLQEPDANQNSHTETFVAIKAEIDNWRWAGVPFYLRTGKRLNKKHSEIVIQFKPQAHNIFKDNYPNLAANKLTIRLQPNEGIELAINNKVPGIADFMQLKENKLDLCFNQAYGNKRVVEAYERLLLEVIQGNQSLFVRRDEVEAAWQWADSIVSAWQSSNEPPKPYECGTWGPLASVALLASENRQWNEE